MHANSTASAIPGSSPSTFESLPGSSARPVTHQLHTAMTMPVMSARPAVAQGLPDQPDHAGMRERRAQSETSVAALQRSRGIEPADNPHEQMLEAYGYRQLAEALQWTASGILRGLGHLANALPDIHLGPRACAGAAARLTPEIFIAKHSEDFHVWRSHAALAADDMKGMLIVIGEHHCDIAIQQKIMRVMVDLGKIPGLRLFSEGGEPELCELRQDQYNIAGLSCTLLEDDLPDYAEILEAMQDFRQKLERAVAFLRRHVPSARDDRSDTDTTDELQEFIVRHQRAVPAEAVQKYNPLALKVQQAADATDALMKSYDPKKEAWMARRLRSEMSSTAPNVAVVGADHLRGMLRLLMDAKCIFMLPKTLARKFPHTALPRQRKDEL